MNTDRTTEVIVESWLADGFTAQPDVERMLQNVRAGADGTAQRRRRWWPFGRAVGAPVTALGQTPARGFTMFSALKFIAAAAIVALFGGFLLAGVPTTQQGDEMAPAAVTESPSPVTTEELLSGMVTEEVEPGVSRVVNDGVRDLAHRADGFPGAFVDIMPNGSVWLSGGRGKYDLFQFGREPTWRRIGDPGFREVSPDGSIEWEDVPGLDGWRDALVQKTAIAQDGTLWRAFRDDGPDTQALARLDYSGWTVFTEADGVPIWGQHVGVFFSTYLLDIAPDGTVWVNVSAAPHGCDGVASFDGTTWTRYLRGRCVHDLDIAHDGMVWVRAYLEDTGVEGALPRVGTFVIRPTTAAA